MEIIKTISSNTHLREGEIHHLPHNECIWNDLTPYERDEWAKNFLLKNDQPVREVVYVGRRFVHGECIGLSIVSFDWK